MNSFVLSLILFCVVGFEIAEGNPDEQKICKSIRLIHQDLENPYRFRCHVSTDKFGSNDFNCKHWEIKTENGVKLIADE